MNPTEAYNGRDANRQNAYDSIPWFEVRLSFPVAIRKMSRRKFGDEECADCVSIAIQAVTDPGSF